MTRYQIFCTSEMVCCDCVLIASFLPFFPTVRHFIFANHRPTCRNYTIFHGKCQEGREKKPIFSGEKRLVIFPSFFQKKRKKPLFPQRTARNNGKNSHIIRRKQRESNTPCRLVAESRTGFGRTGKKLLLPVTSFKSYCEYTEIVGCSRRFLSWIFFKNQIRKLCRIHAPALPHSFGEKQPAVAPVAVVVVDN